MKAKDRQVLLAVTGAGLVVGGFLSGSRSTHSRCQFD